MRYIGVILTGTMRRNAEAMTLHTLTAAVGDKRAFLVDDRWEAEEALENFFAKRPEHVTNKTVCFVFNLDGQNVGGSNVGSQHIHWKIEPNYQ